MKTYGSAVFETALGHCGIVWSERGVAGVQLPEATAPATRRRIEQRFPSASEGVPPPEIERAIDAIRALLRGEHRDLSLVALDLDAKEPFERSVYEIARTIPPGQTLTYGDIAKRLGITRDARDAGRARDARDAGRARDARDVGRALGDNPIPIIVPCHRVVAADGRMHGFSGPGGVKTKLKLLEIEGYERIPGPSLFDLPQ